MQLQPEAHPERENLYENEVNNTLTVNYDPGIMEQTTLRYNQEHIWDIDILSESSDVRLCKF